MSPYWPVVDGHFLPLPFEEAELSREAGALVERIRSLDPGVPVFLRGSIIEEQNPFPLSDVDIMVFSDRPPERKLEAALRGSTNRFVDLKWIRTRAAHPDLVQDALLAVRSLQVTGEPVRHARIPADGRFAWEHWVRYFPHGLPDTLECNAPRAPVFFKLLDR